MNWNKDDLKLSDGRIVKAQYPQIISASRSTDIPAFYADWFFNRLKKGYCAWTNPFNGVKSYVAFRDTRFVVFWSKNPKPLLDHLDELKDRNIGCYIQYTLNDYVKEGLEKGVPTLDKRIDIFKRLVEKLGNGHVIWRFDPLMLTDEINEDLLLEKISNIAEQLKGYTEKIVFSFADILSYKKVKRNLDDNNVHYLDWQPEQMVDFARRLSDANKEWGFNLATCAEKIDLSKYGIEHNKCIDDDLMIKLAWQDKALMNFLGVEIYQKDLFGVIPKEAIVLSDNLYALKKKNNKDTGQRMFCGCANSKDVGQYNTCPHQCEYCYANTTKALAQRNYKMHLLHPDAETITGD